MKFGSMFTFSEFKDKEGVVKDNVFILTPLDNSSAKEENDFSDIKEAAEELDKPNVEDVINEIIEEENCEDALPF